MSSTAAVCGILRTIFGSVERVPQHLLTIALEAGPDQVTRVAYTLGTRVVRASPEAMAAELLRLTAPTGSSIGHRLMTFRLKSLPYPPLPAVHPDKLERVLSETLRGDLRGQSLQDFISWSRTEGVVRRFEPRAFIAPADLDINAADVNRLFVQKYGPVGVRQRGMKRLDNAVGVYLYKESRSIESIERGEYPAGTFIEDCILFRLIGENRPAVLADYHRANVAQRVATDGEGSYPFHDCIRYTLKMLVTPEARRKAGLTERIFYYRSEEAFSRLLCADFRPIGVDEPLKVNDLILYIDSDQLFTANIKHVGRVVYAQADLVLVESKPGYFHRPSIHPLESIHAKEYGFRYVAVRPSVESSTAAERTLGQAGFRIPDLKVLSDEEILARAERHGTTLRRLYENPVTRDEFYRLF